MLPALLNPKTVFTALDDIDSTHPSHTADRSTGSKRALIIIFSVCVSLLFLNYIMNYRAMYGFFELLSLWLGHDVNYITNKVRATGFDSLISFAWWSGTHVVAFVIIPSFVIRFYLKQKIWDFGWGWGETHSHWRGYAFLLGSILVMIIFASQRPDFIHHYPFYKDSARSWLDFISWEILYLIQFACLEFFFRGYMVQSLRPHFGSTAIWIMLTPYLMIHFQKPWLEATGAIFFGLFLGILALRSRSIWGGFCVHAGVAVGMDVASLIQQGKIPKILFPEL